MAVPAIDVAALQREMVETEGSIAEEVMKTMLKPPSMEVPASDDVSVLRGQVHELQARMRAYQSEAEHAVYEVERRHRQAEKLRDNAGGGKGFGSIKSTTPQSARSGRIEEPVSPLRLRTVTPEASPIPLLDAIGNLISAEEEEEGWDLLKDDVKRRGTHSTVGIRIAQGSNAPDLRPLQIQIIIPGSSAHICGRLNRGDEIVAVDGVPVTEDNIVQSVRGPDQVGSRVRLGIKKGGKGPNFEVELVRGAWGAVERKERLFILFEEVVKCIDRDGTKEEIMILMTRLIEQAKDNEKYRTINEMRIYDRLQHLQTEMKRLLDLARMRCLALLRGLDEAQLQLSRQHHELTVPLHERVEDYVIGLQEQLAEAERLRDAAQKRANAASKWIESIREMHDLAAFSRRRIRNWEKEYGPGADVATAVTLMQG
mmetsp:Transcript_11460/g.28106  ORF Transcript_11460/g.28106 Transcript_11460/m.28106 type:complete len:427 (+) Transcript_11460:223-1503(+)